MQRIKITSTSNQLIKSLARLKNGTDVAEQGIFVLEGERLVQDFLNYQSQTRFKLKHLIVREDKKGFANADIQVSAAVFEKISQTVSPQGVMAVIEFDLSEPTAPSGNFVILDAISDPGNAGTILRTAAACGFSDIYFLNSVFPYSAKVLRASMGGFMFLNIHILACEQLSIFQNEQLVCADLSGKNALTFNYGKKSGLIIGNEAHGVSERLKALANNTVAIPMQNVESLNASVAAAVIMYQMAYADKA